MYLSYLPYANCCIKSLSLRIDIPRRTSNSKVENKTSIETLIDHSEKKYVESGKRKREREKKKEKGIDERKTREKRVKSKEARKCTDSRHDALTPDTFADRMCVHIAIECTRESSHRGTDTRRDFCLVRFQQKRVHSAPVVFRELYKIKKRKHRKNRVTF